jgi:hypothetical protein
MNAYKVALLEVVKIVAIDYGGNVYDVRGTEPVVLPTYMWDHGYLSIRLSGLGMNLPHVSDVKVHRIVAYIKYGKAALESGIDTRHLNGNRQDNSWDNISIGTRKENMGDVSKEVYQHILEACWSGIVPYYQNMSDADKAIIHKERSERAKRQWAQGNIGRKSYQQV